MVHTYIKSCAQMIHNKSQPHSSGPAAMNKAQLCLNLRDHFSHILLMMRLQSQQNTGDEWATIKYKMYAPVRLKVTEGN